MHQSLIDLLDWLLQLLGDLLGEICLLLLIVRGDTLVVGSERNIYTVEQLVAREQNLTVHILLNQAREDPLGIVTSEVLQDVTKHRADVSLLVALLEISYLANQLGLLSSHSRKALIL